MAENIAPTHLSSPEHAINAWVTVAGVRAPVYGIITQGNKVSGYIESKEGAVLLMRGSSLWKTSSRFALPIHSERRESNIHGVRISDTEQRPFTFAKPRLTDDDDIACNDEAVIRNLGTIQLKVFRGTATAQNRKYQHPPPVQAVTLHEQAKKAALSHQTTFGAPVPALEKHHRSSFNYIDPKDSPMLTFEFSYMSRELLELNGHIPASAPEASTSKDIQTIAISDDEDEAEDEEGLDQAEVELAKLQAASQVLVDRLAKSRRGRKSEVEERDIKPDAKKVKLEKGEDVKVKKEENNRSLGSIVIEDDSD